MKTKNSERLKKKKTKLRGNKIILKMEQRSIRKNKSKIKENNTINLIDNDTEEAQNIPSTNIKNNSMEWGTEQNTDNDWELINSEEETNIDDWIQIGPKENKNISSPLVIDTLSNDITSLNFSKMLKQKQKMRLKQNTYTNDTLELNVSNEDNACVTVAKSINIKQSTSQFRHQRPLSSIKSPTKTSPAKTSPAKTSANNSNMTKLYNNFQQQENVQQHEATRNPQVYCIKNIVIVIMKSNSRLCFTGKLLVKVLFGAVEIYGFIFNRSIDTTEVYSPKGYSNVTIETSNGGAVEDSIENVWTALAQRGITRESESKLQMDIDSVQSGAAILVLQNFENNLTRFLKLYFPNFRLFPNVHNPCYYSWMSRKRAEIVLQANLHLEQYDDPNYKRLITDSCITTEIVEKMLSNWCMNEWSCTLVAGGKSVGKSTSVRYLINSLLRTTGKVVLIDVDPGQTECTPAGCISYSLIEEPLMGPNFTHLRMPVYQLFIDDVNVARCVTRYLEGVKMLIEKLQQCPVLSRLPVVVNTMGFTMNIGWDIAIFTIKLIRPTIILQIMSSKKKNNYQDYLSAEVINNQECRWMCWDNTFIDWYKPCQHDLCIISSRAETYRDEYNMEPYQQRELVMISYLSGMYNNDDSLYNAELYDINKVVPYTTPFSSLSIIPQRLFGVPASHALSIINGNIVALCGIDLTEESLSEESISGLRVLTQRSSLCTCYGFGIIRGIDTERQEIFINTPLPISIMQHINCLAGCIPVPPVLLQLNQGAPYVGETDKSLPTSREVRKGTFRVKPNTKYHKKLNIFD